MPVADVVAVRLVCRTPTYAAATDGFEDFTTCVCALSGEHML